MVKLLLSLEEYLIKNLKNCNLQFEYKSQEFQSGLHFLRKSQELQSGLHFLRKSQELQSGLHFLKTKIFVKIFKI